MKNIVYFIKKHARERSRTLDPAHADLFVLGQGLLLSLFILSPGYRYSFIKGLKSSLLWGFRNSFSGLGFIYFSIFLIYPGIKRVLFLSIPYTMRKTALFIDRMNFEISR